MREKFSRLLTISLARKVCLTIFSMSLLARIVAGNLLGQHLDIVGDYRQRRVHFVRHARCEQAERSQFFVLQQLLFECACAG